MATALTALGLWEVPEPWRYRLVDPCRVSALLWGITVPILYLTWRLGPRGTAFESNWAAWFLAAMPLVYPLELLRDGGPHDAWWLIVELAGLPVFAGLAFLGVTRWPWLIAASVLAHGATWDAWHLVVRPSDLPHWYPMLCLLEDIGLGRYFAVRSPRWRQHRGRPRPTITDREWNRG